MEFMQPIPRLAIRGLKKPHKIPPFVLKQLFPDRYRNWKHDRGVVTWNSFNWGDGSTPAQISAINYHMVQALRDDLGGLDVDTAIEIGCGYGRVTPWLSEFAETVIGVDPNREMGSYVQDFHPDVEFVPAAGQQLPFPNDYTDIVFTRSCLQHIPPGEIEIVCSEISRVASPNATILLCEKGRGDGDWEHIWVRGPDTYAKLLDGFELVESRMRETPAKTRVHNRVRMMFRPVT